MKRWAEETELNAQRSDQKNEKRNEKKNMKRLAVETELNAQ